MQRDHQQWGFDRLRRADLRNSWVFRLQRNECQHVDMENALLVVVRQAVAIVVMVNGLMMIIGVVVVMMIRVGSRNRVNCGAVIAIHFVRVRQGGAGRADPHKRCSHDGRNDLTHESHGSILQDNRCASVNRRADQQSPDYGEIQGRSPATRAAGRPSSRERLPQP